LKSKERWAPESFLAAVDNFDSGCDERPQKEKAPV